MGKILQKYLHAEAKKETAIPVKFKGWGGRKKMEDINFIIWW